MNQEQIEQVERQLEQHRHEDFVIDLELTPGYVLQDFEIHAGVFRPDITASVYLARWLFFNADLYRGKDVTEVGSGTGIHGIVTGLLGANSVQFSDIANEAVRNTQSNIQRFGLEDKARCVQSDLFRNVEGRADVIIFNHPWFAGEPYANVPVSRSMLGGIQLLPRFLEQARDFLNSGGITIHSYWDFAGPENNPRLRGPEFGYSVQERFSMTVGTGLQQGPFSVYALMAGK